MTLYSHLRSITFAGAICALASLMPAVTRADGTQDFYFQRALERYTFLPRDARSFGMAGSTAVIAANSNAIWHNPAGLGMMQGGEVTAGWNGDAISGNEYPTYRDIEQDADTVFGLLAMPLGPTPDGPSQYGNFGLGIYGYDGDTNDTLNSKNEGTVLTGSYGINISPTMSLGYGLSWFDDKLSGDTFEYDTSSKFRHTIGVQSRYNHNTVLGSSLWLGHGEYDSDLTVGEGNSDIFQVGFELGAAWQTERLLWALSAGYSYVDTSGDFDTGVPLEVVGGDEDGHVFDLRAGVEAPLLEWLHLRAGYRYAGLQDYSWSRDDLEDALGNSAKYNAWTLGAGVLIPVEMQYVRHLRLDYGVEYRAVGDDDWQHVAQLSIPFDPCYKLARG